MHSALRNVCKSLFPVLVLVGSAFPSAFAKPAAHVADDEMVVSSAVPSRVLSAVSDEKLVKLTGDMHPMARSEFDQGPLESGRMLKKMVLVLQRSPEQEAALAAFNERQYDAKSSDFHHWLHAEEFGRLYGPSDADLEAVTSWLHSHGFSIDLVSKGRVSIQFTGTVAQVQEAFHLEMHRYTVDGVEHLANDRDPSIPEALAPVIKGIASLNNFFPRHYSHAGDYVKRDLKTGKYTVLDKQPLDNKLHESKFPAAAPTKLGDKSPRGGIQPEFGYTDPDTGYQREELSPYDVATIYNVLPLWNESTPVNGKGVKVAIVGLSDVETSDFNTYRSSFGLPAGTLTTLHSGSDPGYNDSQGENTEDSEMVSATAPGAQVVLVADVDNDTTNGLVTAITYIVDNEVAPILTMSYGECELLNGSSQNSLYNSTFQQAATAGISSFVAAGDSGSAVCTSQNGNPPYADTYGLAVSGMASTPYVTAVGGTDLQWPFSSNPVSTYWNSTNDAHGATAKGYMPEMSWNDTCSNPLLLNVYTSYSNVEDLCNAAINGSPGLVEMGAGSGGVSTLYSKPSWQTGVSGIPSDGKRDLPDVSMFAAYGFQSSTGIPGSALLICQASGSPENSCDYSNPDYIIYQENGGTSAASPLTAGIMALVIQKTGATQGLANPVFYQLAAKESYSSCNSNTVKPGNSCIFNDTTSGANAAVCITGDPNCVTNTSGDEVGILSGYNATTGYDLTTGLGSFNVANLVNGWPTTSTGTITVSPTSFAFPSTNVSTVSSTKGTITVKNTTTAAVSFSSASFTGSNATSFSAATTCPIGSTLAAGASCTVTVSFDPTTTGNLTGTLNLVDGKGTQTVALTGTGTAAATPTVTLSPTSLTFASTVVGSTTAAQTVTLKNTGTVSTTISSITVTGTDDSSFLKSATTCGSSLASGASCTISVEFKPAAAGSLTAALSVADNATGTPQTVKLTGTGTAAATAPVVSLSPTSLTFAKTTVGSTGAYQTVTLKNTGTATLDIKSFTVSGTEGASFGIRDQTCGSTVAAGASCTFKVAFTPKAAGTLTAAIAIADNAANSPQTVALTGTGASSTTTTVSLTPTSLTYAATTVGKTAGYQTVTLKNTGSATLSITSFGVAGPDGSSYGIRDQACGSTLAAAASCTFKVAFTPKTTGTLTSAIVVTDNATGSTQKVTLTGTGK